MSEIPPRLSKREFHLAQLRHLYTQMWHGHVSDTTGAARGLLGPAIEALEPLVNAEAQVVEALEAAERVLEMNGCRDAPGSAIYKVRTVIALLRGDRPGEGGE